MSASRNLLTALLMTIVLTMLLGVAYPLSVTGLAQLLFHDEANGQLIERNGGFVGSAIIGQAFTSPLYFHGRPSAAGRGYDATRSGGTNLGPTNSRLIAAVTTAADAARTDNRRDPPVDLVTSSASGLDPDISPDAAMYQVPRVARARGIPESELRVFVESRVDGRQLGLLGEPRVNVLLLNLALDERYSSTNR